MAPRVRFVVPGALDTATGGYAYDRRIVDGLRALGWQVGVHCLGADFPHPSAASSAHADAVLASFAAGERVVVDGLALGAMPAIAHRHAQRLRLVALVHHPLALETGLDRSVAQALAQAERDALRAVRRIVVTSAATARLLRADGVAPERIDVVEPGTDPVPPARGSGGERVALLCVATVTPRKGHAVLLDALAPLVDLRWQLVCAGSVERDPACAAAVRERIGAHGLTQRVALLGEVDSQRLPSLYERADAFVLASFVEGYGMALAEAIAHGLPVVATRTGACDEIAPDGAALWVPPGDSQALSAALRQLIEQPPLRQRLAAAAWAAGERLPRWPDCVQRFAHALQRVPE
ncbi:MAG TPA: glycosyltransferase family 4 protein [Burkholderiaceae bacterium]|nr:glycosyltransferase family 4 protein [Burkholderiaceae bacterium]